ncbi:hypothetical protein F7C95_09120 [Opitutia bacterium ISCC 51]|nr:hypothetical protein F7C95_18690 [Opitutae bacterium ISCC 51]QXD26016.1 hypothetical protein F7C95_09120 [Opitutae bacterium ISCC 51]QXD27988.1 hypothetical protein GA003_18595 [Opitutae bacterium ISCC 52]QXD30084.1 hypothetical protein GA003_09065 [Opitutae bacterium ISCC 52]
MIPLFRIVSCLIGINALLIQALPGTVISIGGNGTADLPLGWSVTLNLNGTTYIESGAGGVSVLFSYQEFADSHKTIQAINYDGINAVLSADLER